jgi:transposase
MVAIEPSIGRAVRSKSAATLIAAAYLEGVTVRTIMRRYAVSSCTVYGILKKKRIKPNRPKGTPWKVDAETRKKVAEERKLGVHLKVLGRKYGLSFQTIHRIAGSQRGLKQPRFKKINPWGK